MGASKLGERRARGRATKGSGQGDKLRSPRRVDEARESAGKVRRFGPGEVLYRDGDQIEAACRVHRGLVKLMTHLENGDARIVRLQRRGDWMGLGGLLGRPHAHTAIAVTEVELDLFPLTLLHELAETEPEAFARLLGQWHGDLAKADKWIADFSTGNIRKRVARLIGYLVELGQEEFERGAVNLLTVQEMGEILGVTPESVSRTIAGFKRNGVLRKRASGRRGAYRVDVELLARELDRF